MTDLARRLWQSRRSGGVVGVDECEHPRSSEEGAGAETGEIVSTGTCTGLDSVQAGDRVAADFGDLGKVEIAFD